ncbi:MAG: hypothetical protein LKI30_07785 [Bifidobacterium crudilactis]|jgi:hypothetical protein|nr:hypothetical protein [Bifidobacterium crudilactis]
MSNTTPKYSVKAINLTPAMAKEILAANTHNRKITQNKVNIWAETMKRGEWQMNGEAIKISSQGVVLDGQHRLLAVVQSGVTIPILIIKGLSADTQSTMDIGKSRTLADVLSLEGETNATTLASVLTGLVIWDKYSPSVAFTGGRQYAITNGEAFDFLRQHPEVREVAKAVGQPARNACLTQKVLGILYFHFSEIDQESADAFLLKLSTGTELGAKDPILTLRNTLKSLRNSKKVGQIPPRYLAALTIKAWNKWIRGEEANTLRYNPGGAVKEKFPTIVGPIGTDTDFENLIEAA